MSVVVIEVPKIKAIKVGEEWISIGKRSVVSDKDCEFRDQDEDVVGEFAGGVLAFTGSDGEDYVVSLADIKAFRMR